MEQIHIIALVLIVVIFLLTAGIFRVFRRRQVDQNEAQIEYIAGLNNLIDGDYEKALDHLRKTVRINTELVDAYIKIGDILRIQGYADKAVKIHRDLLIRHELGNARRISILMSLAKDYHKNKNYLQAVTTLEEVLSIDRQNEASKELLQLVYEDMEDWRKAYDLLKKSNKQDKEHKARILACFKLEEGLKLTKINKEHDARLCFREAMKLDKTCSGAYLELAHSYIREHRLKDALTALKQLMQNNPKDSALAFERMKDVLFDLGQFGDLEKLYIELIKSNPEVMEAHLGLAELSEKKGEYLKAIEICQSALVTDPDRLELKLMLIRLKSKLGLTDDAVEMAQKLAEGIMQEHHDYICTGCGYKSVSYFWHCPECKAWNSTKRVKIAYR
ncbi:MAG TPA: tetratricopeptide repeat protein [bacterium]|nr:tetratricopeptide repeat protein [bacterium]HPN44135.1 tetratricopeptide repeat protein [bacterium]